MSSFKNDVSEQEFTVIINRNNVTNVAVNVADKLSDRQRLILDIIINDVAVNIAVKTRYLSSKIGVNRKTIQRDLSVLVNMKKIQWNGSDKNGHWEIVK